MNGWLAKIYGTDGGASQEEEFEKTAQMHLLQKLAADEGLDINQFTPEELQNLAAEVFEQDEESDQEAAPQQGQVQGFMQQQQPVSQEMQIKEAQAKYEEADMLGRVMAHAYTQELEKIASFKDKAKAFGSAASMAGKRGVSKAKNFGAAADKKVQSFGQRAIETGTRSGKGSAANARPGLKRGVGYGAAGAAAGAAGYAAGRGKSKEASAFEKLAEQQAAEILSATGFDPQTGQDTVGQQFAQQQTQQRPSFSGFGQGGQQPAQQGSQFLGQAPNFAQGVQGEQGQEDESQDEFQSALDERSLQMLAEAGYPVDEIVARIQHLQQQGQQGQA